MGLKSAEIMNANFRGSFEIETKNEKDSLTVVDLDNPDDGENCEGGFVSPTELTKINFRSLIGHTDEVRRLNTLTYL